MSENDDKSKLKVYPYDTRLTPIAVPPVGVFDAPTRALCINTQWLSHIDGLLDRLLWRDAWEGTEEQIDNAIQQVRLLLAFNQCECGGCMDCCNELLSEIATVRGGQNTTINNYRIENQTAIESNTIATVGPNYGSSGLSVLCTALNFYVRTKMLEALNFKRAVSGVARLTQLVLGNTLTTAFDGILGGRAFAVAYANEVAYEDAFNDAIANDAIICAIRNNMDITAISQSNFISAITSIIPVGTNQTLITDTLNAGATDTLNYLFFLDCLARAVPVGASGISVCNCPENVWNIEYLFTASNGGWSANQYCAGNNVGVYVGGDGWQHATGIRNSNCVLVSAWRIADIGININTGIANITRLEVEYNSIRGSGFTAIQGFMTPTLLGSTTPITLFLSRSPMPLPNGLKTEVWEGNVPMDKERFRVRVWASETAGNGTATIKRIRIFGTGVNPFI